MFTLLRTGRLATALIMISALFATPSLAAEAEAVAVSAKPVAITPSVYSMPAAAPAPQTVVTAQPPQPVIAPAMQTPPQQQRPLRDMVIAFVDYGDQDAQQECLAKAVYFEARSESLEGQLAVAEVVLNRAASGIYPPTICEVVTQPAQFSFIRGGQFPRPDRSSVSWHRALAIADIARKKLAQTIPPNVLWYHADYVSPSWGRRLNRVAQIGTHIFYS